MTKEQRTILKQKIEDSLSAKFDSYESFYYRNYEDALSKLVDNEYLESIKGEKISNQYLGKTFSDIASKYNYQYSKLNFSFHIYFQNIRDWKKEKNLLTLIVSDKLNFVYDFNTKKFTTPIPQGHLQYISDCPEWIFNYKEFLSPDFSSLYNVASEMKNKNCPKGYINWLKENNGTISVASLLLYEYSKNTDWLKGFFGRKIKSELERGNDSEEIKCYIKDFKKIDKMFFDDETISNIYYRLFTQVMGRYIEMSICEGFEIDDNRGINYNFNLYTEWKNKHKNELLSQKLQKLNFLNNMEYGNYIIKIPQDIKDLQTEGSSQNNCVGYFYNESIIQGRNYIYFIRLKDNPNKSYITARYNVQDRGTMEYKFPNNCTVTDENAITLIHQLDLVIQKELEGK